MENEYPATEQERIRKKAEWSDRYEAENERRKKYYNPNCYKPLGNIIEY